MASLFCQHNNPTAENVEVCDHVFTIKDQGVKFYTGDAQNVIYRCSECDKDKDHTRHFICVNCINDLEEQVNWYIEGVPEVKRMPQPFTFETRQLVVPELGDCKVLASAPLYGSTTDLLVYTSKGQAWLLNVATGDVQLKKEYSNECICVEGEVYLTVSRDHRYASVTSTVHGHKEHPASNKGMVFDLITGEDKLVLSCGDYHTELTPFPVVFVEHNNKTMLVHATDWDRLDTTDLETGLIITGRDVEEMPEDDDNDVSTEWSGTLLLSPDQRRIATIGWIWHPIGVATSFDVQKWLNGSKWEAEIGQSLRSYTIWDYYWSSSFLWLDDKRLCIWGPLDKQDAHGNPLDCVGIYNADTEKQLGFITGPTNDFLFFDTYLFSGMKDDSGLAVWSIEEGALVHEERGLNAHEYLPERKEFVEFGEQGRILFSKWRG